MKTLSILGLSLALCLSANASEALKCYKIATQTKIVIDSDGDTRTMDPAGAVDLCHGTEDATATIDCFKNASQLRVLNGRRMSPGGAVDLCSGGHDAGAPALCFVRTGQETQIDLRGRVLLCSGTSDASTTLDCYFAAKGLVSSAGAVRLCSKNLNRL